MQKKESIRMLTYSAIFTALIAVGAFIKIPIPLWPFTLQTFFTTAAALLLGARYGALSCVAYMLLGLMGLPVFTGGGGPQYVFHPTFGCIIGFAVGAVAAGTIVQRVKKRNFVLYLTAGLVDIFIVYLIGIIWFWGVKTFYMRDPIGLWAVFTTCFVPTIGIDILKCAGAATLAVRLPIARSLPENR